ncbi:hypothetical protein LTR36_001497 [Oleoguttula mirabilis]|uniref:F-box domain-containing protein n=1 Tax=Oleoguttula mirabilis TaxID=1507867 RepID=A0AAV9JMI4_9PEZI|nr:hypothetical protein LTR36_001497 [Oleoguttula mirabilis]
MDLPAQSSSHASIATAGERLTSTVELLEQVLLQLPLRDIFLAQRVNKYFASVIKTSIHIQRTLFLTPEPPSSHDTSSGVRVNPLLYDPSFAHHLPLWYDRVLKTLRYGDRPDLDMVDHIHFTKVRVLQYYQPFVLIEGYSGRADVHPTLAQGSGLQMYLTQPRCQIVVQIELEDADYEDLFVEGCTTHDLLLKLPMGGDWYRE